MHNLLQNGILEKVELQCEGYLEIDWRAKKQQLKKKVPGVCGQALNFVARNCETEHKKAVFDIIQIVHKL